MDELNTSDDIIENRSQIDIHLMIDSTYIKNIENTRRKSTYAKRSLPCKDVRVVENSLRLLYIEQTLARSTTQRAPAMDVLYREIYKMKPEEAKLRLLHMYWKTDNIAETARQKKFF